MIDVDKFKTIFKDVLIIDLRTPTAYNNGHIEGSRNIPYNLLIKNPKEYLTFNNIYYLYCQKGETSKRICAYLKKIGYKVVNINGGYEEWIMES